MTGTIELAKTYQPSDVEGEMALAWSNANAFGADPADADRSNPYCIVIPPPNVTAALHMGHALNNTLQDILIRWRRMCGDNTLWMPGTDHAGIATQTVVEKRVIEEEGRKRTDFGREEFVAKIQAWKDEYEKQITEQLKAMGCSCDWARQRFTMDPICAKAVREAFFQLFEDGLVYRGKRLVNWDPATQTALADDEVEMEEIDGYFWYLKYPLEDGGGFVTVATTRPETMLGDTAVAVNPKDPRAEQLRGKKVRLPIVNRLVPVIEDDYVVLPDQEGDEKARYSSGFLKVTPAHDPNDYEIGQRFDLPVINVMAPDGSISDQYGWPEADFAQGNARFLLGLDRDKARGAVVQWFKENGLLEDTRAYRHSVGHSYRSHVPIEPYLSDQWYVKVTDDRLAGAALRALAKDKSVVGVGNDHGWSGQLHFSPPRYARTFEAWHQNICDWCISRQLWWGHQIPVWSGTGNQAVQFAQGLAGMAGVSICEDQEQSVVYVCLREDDMKLIEALEANTFVRDPDVLDTWFSSGLWPMSTMGWPQDTPELDTWNPGNVLCTAREIITLWVSRMVMMNLYFLDRLPFTDVFVHAMIQDGEGRKMSKSLGNGVDPLDIIHTHGADAMRFTLTQMTTHTQDVRLPVSRDSKTGRNSSDKFDIGRNFANKLWNAARFTLSNFEDEDPTGATKSSDASTGAPDFIDRWMVSRLATAVRDANHALENFEFSQYAQGLYDFFWHDFCDWYIEAVKPTVHHSPGQQKVLVTSLDVVLRLLHPIMPFVSEKLWQRLNQVAPVRGLEGVIVPGGELLIRADWPIAHESLIDPEIDAEFKSLQSWVGAIREVRTSHQIPPRQTVTYCAQVDDQTAALLQRHGHYLKVLANAVTGPVGPKMKDDLEGLSLIGTTQIGDHQIRVYREGETEVGRETERNRLENKIEDIRKSIKTLQGRLGNKGYVDKAPSHLVQQTRDQLASAEREAHVLDEQLRKLG
ncbi:MAG: valine--tRNA ligase [Phycisphaeraceae bacterium]|nr:valine--tRNA ligase [Phycisphaeraceae bacterium]